jgi:hypothetical protein
MTKKPKQSKKAAKKSKRTKGPAELDEETDMTIKSTLAEAPQATPETKEAEVQPATVAVPAEGTQEPASEAPQATAPATPGTRSPEAKANIKEGLRLHQIAGRPTKAQLITVFGPKGYLMTWPKRAEKFGITPETFQAALAEKTKG